MSKYILDGKKPVLCDDVIKWSGWWEKIENRRVGFDQIGNAEVSTVFLGIDHNFDRVGDPILFEMLVRGGTLDESGSRYCTWDEAEAGHARWVKRLGGAVETS